jgi:AraC-like DNA-binding protein
VSGVSRAIGRVSRYSVFEKSMLSNPKTDSSPAADIERLATILAARIARYVGKNERLMTIVPRLSVHRRTAQTSPCSITYEPSLIVVAQGRKQVDLGRASWTYDRSRFLLTSVDLPILSRVADASEASPCLAIMLRLEMDIVRDVLRNQETAGWAIPEGPAVITGPNTPELLDACNRLLALVDTPDHIPFLAPMIEREIVYWLLQGSEGARLRAIATLGDTSNRTAAAIGWIQSNYLRPLNIDKLAQTAGMAVSTFHHHFRALTSMSPLQYQKQLRLQRAHSLMLVEGLDAARAAFAVGYESTSQFNREYRRLFGEPPRRNVKSRRAPLAAA